MFRGLSGLFYFCDKNPCRVSNNADRTIFSSSQARRSRPTRRKRLRLLRGAVSRGARGSLPDPDAGVGRPPGALGAQPGRAPCPGRGGGRELRPRSGSGRGQPWGGRREIPGRGARPGQAPPEGRGRSAGEGGSRAQTKAGRGRRRGGAVTGRRRLRSRGRAAGRGLGWARVSAGPRPGLGWAGWGGMGVPRRAAGRGRRGAAAAPSFPAREGGERGWGGAPRRLPAAR